MHNYTSFAVYQLQNITGFERSKFSTKLFLPSVQVHLLVFIFIFLFANNAFATTDWEGDISNDWNTAGNWTAGVPDVSDVVEIQGVALPNVNPIVTGAAVAKAVILGNGGFLTIAVGGTLSIADSQTDGIAIFSSSVENNGTLNINNVTSDGLAIVTGSLFTNRGTINIGNTGDIGGAGIYNESGTFVNESGAIFTNRTCKTSANSGAILNVGSGSFTNKATITIGGALPGLYDGKGIWCDNGSSFLNEAGGHISISRTVSDGLYNSATFTNQGSIEIGIAGDIGGYGIHNYEYFDNTATTAYINIASDNIINNDFGGFYNGGVIIENASGNSSISDNAGVVQNLNGGSFGLSSGVAPITATGQIWTGFSDAEWNNPSNWHNALVPAASDNVTIAVIDATSPILSVNAVAKSVTVPNGAVLTIGGSGTLTINGGAVQGLLNQGTVVNNGLLKIGLTISPGSYGIRNEGQFNNNSGEVKIDKGTQAALFNFSGTFTNNASLSLKTAVAAPFLVNSNGGTISNTAIGTLSGTGVINPTHFTNNGGILSPGYSPGIMTFNGDENFTTSTIAIEVNGTGVEGTAYDQVVVNGTATLGGTLALTFNFPNPTSGDVVKILDATALTGTFSTVTGLPNGWIVNYNEVNQGEITLSYLVSLPVTLIRFSATKKDRGVKLDWQTSEESNNQGFDIERKHDGGNWENIGYVDGHGSTKENSTYSFLDLNPLSGMNYYRLRQVDYDGHTEFSRIVGVKIDSENVVKIYPNPTTGIIHIEGAQSNVKIMDILGRPVINGTIINQKIDVSHLPGGFYILSVFSKNKEKSIPIVKQ
jgi:hypothetical protein